MREQDLNLRPSGYEPDELPDCSIPRQQTAYNPAVGGDASAAEREFSFFFRGGDSAGRITPSGQPGHGSLATPRNRNRRSSPRRSPRAWPRRRTDCVANPARSVVARGLRHPKGCPHTISWSLKPYPSSHPAALEPSPICMFVGSVAGFRPIHPPTAGSARAPPPGSRQSPVKSGATVRLHGIFLRKESHGGRRQPKSMISDHEKPRCRQG